jgi:hypothetical protein
MSDRPSHNLGGLDIDLARRIDEVCRQLGADVRERRQPRIDDPPLGLVTRVRRVTVVAFHRIKLNLPAFELRSTEVARQPLDVNPPWMLVDVPEYPQFSAQYTLYAQDIAALQRVFSHDLIGALERRRGWCVEGLGPWFIAYHHKGPETFLSLMALIVPDLQPKSLECAEPEDLDARLNTARHLFLFMTTKR